MAIPHIMPIGFVDGASRDGVVILLTNPDVWEHRGRNAGDHLEVQPRDTFDRWNKGRDQRGGICFRHHYHHGNRTGPQGQDILKRGAPVYLAQPGTFEPDESRMLTQEQTNEMASLAATYADLTRKKTPERARAGRNFPSPNGRNNHNNPP